MIKTREQWEYYQKHLRGMLDGMASANVIETIEALLEVARAADRQERMSPGTLSPNTMNALANLKPWMTEEE